VNRSITDWNQLPERAIETSHGKTHIFKTRVSVNSGGSEGDKKQKVKAREVKGSDM
jgi:hypothetical protein